MGERGRQEMTTVRGVPLRYLLDPGVARLVKDGYLHAAGEEWAMKGAGVVVSPWADTLPTRNFRVDSIRPATGGGRR